MRYFILLFALSFMFTNAQEIKEKESIKNKNIQKQMKLEKKYAKEKYFYKGSEYDLSSAEVNEDSVKNLPERQNRNEDFDMDNVYD